jgi:hypothetical protein
MRVGVGEVGWGRLNFINGDLIAGISVDVFAYRHVVFGKLNR